MTQGQGSRRKYSSPLRERQREATRRQILETVAELIVEGAIHSFTVQEVADRAGISYPSVYRYFPTRESLLQAAYEAASAAVRDEMPPDPGSLAEVPEWIAASMRVFERYGTLARALPAMVGALDLKIPVQRQRDEMLERLVREGAPRLPPEQVRPVAALLRFLASAQAWSTLRGRFALEAEEASGSLVWALQVLIGDLQAGPEREP